MCLRRAVQMACRTPQTSNLAETWVVWPHHTYCTAAEAAEAATAAAAAGHLPLSAPPANEQRILNAAIVGLPNAGKSTLVNRLTCSKISGVSSKRNTTITPQLGCFAEGVTQVLLYDTPGLVDQPQRGSPVERLRTAWTTAATADLLLLIVDADRQVSISKRQTAGVPQAVSGCVHNQLCLASCRSVCRSRWGPA
jgi:predicted GTPase